MSVEILEPKTFFRHSKEVATIKASYEGVHYTFLIPSLSLKHCAFLCQHLSASGSTIDFETLYSKYHSQLITCIAIAVSEIPTINPGIEKIELIERVFDKDELMSVWDIVLTQMEMVYKCPNLVGISDVEALSLSQAYAMQRVANIMVNQNNIN
ncbi:hypothetical protein ABDK00_013230 [Niabella insulamsoli]|uniref:hypothetical protein n=1 Tax=Niabella insulamsoli TaxID=3144874 RepID=UPI0031FD00DF